MDKMDDLTGLTRPTFEKQPPLGGGQRFAALTAKLSKQKGVRDPKALAASIGRAVHGPKKMASIAAAGRDSGC